MRDVRFAFCRISVVNTSLWLIETNQQSPKTGDSQNQKGIGSRPDPFRARFLNLGSDVTEFRKLPPYITVNYF